MRDVFFRVRRFQEVPRRNFGVSRKGARGLEAQYLNFDAQTTVRPIYKSLSPDCEKSKLNSRQYLRKSIWNSPYVLHCFLPVEQARRCEWQLQRGLEPCLSLANRYGRLSSEDVTYVFSVRETFPINQSQLCFSRCGLQRNQSSPPPVKSFLRSSKQLT